jgi:hypothetical protein
MTIVHDNEFIKNKRTIIRNNGVSINNFEENIEILKFQTNEEDDEKCKSDAIYFCHMLSNNSFFFFRSSFFFFLPITNIIRDSHICLRLLLLIVM